MDSNDVKKSRSDEGVAKVDIENVVPATLASHKRGESVVEWTLPKFDIASIKSKLSSHEHFEIKSGYTMSGLPKFHDLTA